MFGPDGSVSILSPGGCYGNSRERDRALILHDLKKGKGSLYKALSDDIALIRIDEMGSNPMVSIPGTATFAVDRNLLVLEEPFGPLIRHKN